ncbi:MAG: AEC family transporter [Richelia sp. RM2_1_2]|nr:AEC family transporter [Richelia sp. SM2_1_7]NJN12543.1 AEC family transporter [Richelia sp. RM1_1_1]NJO30895.1 AEC family transporter [Richelia sp. SL_2_1]NJO64431.1 AEC family transporter [Richelia sp. RM2_1_2]NJS16014.1 AEC family transporter [Nostocaceae cyanobacterium CSU_2_110]
MTNLLELYLKLSGLVLIGFILGRRLPSTVPTRLAQFLFWIGIPIGIVAFLRQADLSGAVLIAPAVAYLAILLGAFFAWMGIKWHCYFTNTIPQSPTQGSFILSAMVGNTGFLGYPIALSIYGTEYFAWALFYDLLGSLFGTWGLGVALAARFGGSAANFWQNIKVLLINPALWSFGFGLLFRQVKIPQVAEFYLEKFGWSGIILSLVLMGMRLSRLHSWQNVPQAGASVAIKMLLVPLILGISLPLLGVTGTPAQIILLQTAMPPAFSTLIIAEAFKLDSDLAVSTIALGTVLLLVTLPIWLALF